MEQRIDPWTLFDSQAGSYASHAVAVVECHVFPLFPSLFYLLLSSCLPLFLSSSLFYPPSSFSLQLLEKDAPELFELMEEFQDKFTFVMDTLCPLIKAARRDSEVFTSQVRGRVYVNINS